MLQTQADPTSTPTASPVPEAQPTPTPPAAMDKEELRVGFLYPGDQSDQGYTRNLAAGAAELAQDLELEEGQILERYNVGTEEDPAQAAQALADQGCQIVFSTSAAFREEMIQAAEEHRRCSSARSPEGRRRRRKPGRKTCTSTTRPSMRGRYLAGIAAGLKAKELGNPRLGYVAPEACAEVISGFTAFYLGARSVYPEAVMDVLYTGSWDDAALDSRAAKTLVNRGCAVLGQHTDSTGAATMAEQLGAFYAGFGSDQRSHAPGAALLSVGVNWGIYFTQAVQGVLDGSGVPEEWNLGWAVGAVALTPLNESLAASGTQEALEAAEQALSAGELEVFSGPLQGENAAGETLELAEGEHYAEGTPDCGPTFDYLVEGDHGGRPELKRSPQTKQERP